MNVLSQNPEIEGVDIYRYQSWTYPESVQATRSVGVQTVPHFHLIFCCVTSKTGRTDQASQEPVARNFRS